MAIPEGYRKNFNTLLQAADDDDLCIAECRDRVTGKTVIAVCAVGRDSEGAYVLAPLAKMFDGNPYDELDPPGVNL